MLYWRITLGIAAAVAAHAAASAEQTGDHEPFAQGVIVTPPAESFAEGTIEPEVTITERDQGEVQEYRVGGQLYMVKIIPTVGQPYYLIDSDGDGLLEEAPNDLEPKTMLPRWVIFRWKR